MSIRCPEAWEAFAPRDELRAIADALGDDDVRLLVRIAARLLRWRVVLWLKERP